jgi:hypothetical protein
MKRPARANGALDGLNRAKPSLGNHPIGCPCGMCQAKQNAISASQAYASNADPINGLFPLLEPAILTAYPPE